jgi:hypothetical protein
MRVKSHSGVFVLFGLALVSLFACGQPNCASEKQDATPPVLDRKGIANEVGLYMRTGDELLKNNKPKDAVNAYERGLKLLEKLEKLSPAPPASGQFPTLLAARFRYMRGLAQSQAKIANQLEAMRFWQQVTNIAKSLFGEECDDAYACLSGYADTAMAAGDLNAARGDRRKGTGSRPCPVIAQGLIADATDLGAYGAISIYRVRVVPISGGVANVCHQASPPVILFFLLSSIGRPPVAQASQDEYRNSMQACQGESESCSNSVGGLTVR